MFVLNRKGFTILNKATESSLNTEIISSNWIDSPLVRGLGGLPIQKMSFSLH